MHIFVSTNVNIKVMVHKAKSSLLFCFLQVYIVVVSLVFIRATQNVFQ